jgi:hypothetical protein
MLYPQIWLLLCLFLAIPVAAQQSIANAPSPKRDLQATTALQQSITAMGGNVPTDSTATGTITRVAGSETDHGTIHILTRSANQTLEQFQTPQGSISEVFSNGQATEVSSSSARPLSLNRAATTRCADFPLPFLAGLISNPDESLQFVGLEQIGTSTLIHLEATNTYASQPGLQILSEFTTTEIWLDAQTYLPTRISWIQRDGGGASPRIRRETDFSNYQTFGGLLYPASIQEFFNGTLWITITVQSVSFNTGLTDADFPVVEAQQ